MSRAGDRGGARRAWIELLRAPNLLTLPGNVLAGAAVVASPGRWPLGPAGAAVAAGLLLYAAGLLAGDTADVEEDRRDRPERPLPSGRVTVGAAKTAARLCGLAGLALAWAAGPVAGILALLLAGLIAAHLAGRKRSAAAAALSLGGCRGLLVALGAAAVTGAMPADLRVAAAAGLFVLYIAAVAAAARSEVGAQATPRGVRILPLAALWAGLGLLAAAGGFPAPGRNLLLALLASVEPARFACFGKSAGTRRPADIGRLLAHLCAIQAVVAVWFEADPARWGLAAVLVLCGGIHHAVSRHVPAS